MTNDINATQRPSRAPASRAVADLADLAYRRAIAGDYWTPAEYRKAIAAYNRAVAAERRRLGDD